MSVQKRLETLLESWQVHCNFCHSCSVWNEGHTPEAMPCHQGKMILVGMKELCDRLNEVTGHGH